MLAERWHSACSAGVSSPKKNREQKCLCEGKRGREVEGSLFVELFGDCFLSVRFFSAPFFDLLHDPF